MNKTDERLERAFALLREQRERERREPVAPYETPGALSERIGLSISETGLDDDDLFLRLDAILAATPRTTTPRFFNQLFGGRDDFGAIGEMFSGFMNNSTYTFKVAGPQVIMERMLTGHMASKVGFDSGEGTFVPGGSMSNLAGMLLALHAKQPESRDRGVGATPLTLYTSQLSHYSIPKNAGILGIGRENVRRIDVDSRGRMRPDRLREAIAADVAADRTPFLIVATSGTTVLGAFDPLSALADAAEEFGLWLHVDGALGGSVALSAKHRHLIDGSERAASFTWNAHKMLGVPLSASVILTREAGVLNSSLNESASYLFQSDEDDYDLGTMTLQCGRRNDALKLWAAWQSHGDEGFGRRVERLFELAQYAAERVRVESSLELTRDPESVTVCFEVEGRQSADLCELLRRESRALVGYGVVDARRVIRLALMNDELTHEDIDAFFDAVLEIAPRAQNGDNTAKGH